MKTLISLSALVLPGLFNPLSFAAEPGSNELKRQLLDAYLQRCVEVLDSKGYNGDAIKAECKCELDQIDQHFVLFEKMLSQANVTAETQQQINEFKQRLLQCKTESTDLMPVAG
tara:strand:- start:11299 stop:11640 length:342 start_codon:yes stop_codon:yes gene_type:complete